MSEPKSIPEGGDPTGGEGDDDFRLTRPRPIQLPPDAAPLGAEGADEQVDDGARTSVMKALTIGDDILSELPTPPHGTAGASAPRDGRYAFRDDSTDSGLMSEDPPGAASELPHAPSRLPSSSPRLPAMPPPHLPSLAELAGDLPAPEIEMGPSEPAPPPEEEFYEKLEPMAGMRVIALHARPSDPPDLALPRYPPLVELPPDPPTLRRSISGAPPAPASAPQDDPGWTPLAAPAAETEGELAEDEIEITEDVAPAPSTARAPMPRSLPPSAPPPSGGPPAPLSSGPQVAPGPPPTPTAAPKRKPWWEELFDQDYLRTVRRLTDRQLLAEVAFIEERLGLQNGAEILDLGCGTGRHANALVQRGYQVVGLDLSPTMIAAASTGGGARASFVQGDMRDLTYDASFDGVVCWGTTFGYFEEDKNAAVLASIRRALRPGGVLLLDIANRDYVAAEQPNLVWFEGTGCVCIDETAVDHITSRLRVKRTMKLEDGRAREIDYSLRLYSLHEIGKLLKDAGFRVVEVSGHAATPGVFFGQTSPRCLVLAERD